MHTFQVGDYVVAGTTREDRDYGRVVAAAGHDLTVAWSSGVSTRVQAAEVKPATAEEYQRWIDT